MDFQPTPLHFLEEDENGNRFFLKREDLLPYSFGGNKARIGAAYLADFRREGASRMIAYGNARSNLCRVLSNLCAGEGIPLTVISPADDGGARQETCNSRLCALFGAEIVPCEKTNVAETVDRVLARSLSRGEKPYYIYGNRLGQGREAVPAAACMPLYGEILRQEKELGLRFDTVALALGTGMTLGGLLAGKTLSAEKRDLLGISVAREGEAALAHTLRYADACLEAAGSGKRASAEDVSVSDAFRENYGVFGPDVAETICGMMTAHGVPMDGTYTGKAWHGLKVLARGWKGKNVLFLHTGGAPLFFDALMKKE